MEYLKMWCDNLLSSPDLAWKHSLTARGECHRQVSPRIWYAAVEITISPAAGFEVEEKLTSPLTTYQDGSRWRDQIIFGVLDVMLTRLVAPIRNFKLTISNIDFNETESNPMAFRLAARTAASKILDQHDSARIK